VWLTYDVASCGYKPNKPQGLLRFWTLKKKGLPLQRTDIFASFYRKDKQNQLADGIENWVWTTLGGPVATATLGEVWGGNGRNNDEVASW
jgi:hypothetical protein